MNPDRPVTLTVGGRSRLAFRFTPDVVRAHIPDRVIGSYLLLDHRRPVYIGRSDKCLRTRLASHPLLGKATHVTWEAAASPARAFLSEAFWYHELADQGSALNLIHPARPAGTAQPCPYCDGGDAERRALLTALRTAPVRLPEPTLRA